jgi:hypothetical protein
MAQMQEEWIWTQGHGDRYRDAYDRLTFRQKQHVHNTILRHYLQVVEPPRYLLHWLPRLGLTAPTVMELGGYDGTQALHVVSTRPGAQWHNYDLSACAQFFTKPGLADLGYTFHLLDAPFWFEDLPQADVFYTSKTLEHFRWREIQSILNKTKHIRYQIHIIDWFWRDDTHVVEGNLHQELVRHLKHCGYRLRDEFMHPERSQIVAELTH